MIKKVEIITNAQPQTELEKAILRTFNGLAMKLNEIIDAVNNIQKGREAERLEIQEWIGILETTRESVNKLETMAKNTNTVLKSLVEENNIREEQINNWLYLAKRKDEPK